MVGHRRPGVIPVRIATAIFPRVGFRISRRRRVPENPTGNRKELSMPKGYWIVRVDITDQDKYKLYMAANAAPFNKYGARFLVRSGRFENPEGTSRTRNVMLEFPTYDTALEC